MTFELKNQGQINLKICFMARNMNFFFKYFCRGSSYLVQRLPMVLTRQGKSWIANMNLESKARVNYIENLCCDSYRQLLFHFISLCLYLAQLFRMV